MFNFQISLEKEAIESESLVRKLHPNINIFFSLKSRAAWDCCLKIIIWGKWLITLNNTVRPIANKYCEGKLKRTLKRELKIRMWNWLERTEKEVQKNKILTYNGYHKWNKNSILFWKIIYERKIGYAFQKKIYSICYFVYEIKYRYYYWKRIIVVFFSIWRTSC